MNAEKIAHLEEMAKRAWVNRSYWMNYMTPIGMPCNRSMIAADEQWRSIEAELRDLKRAQ